MLACIKVLGEASPTNLSVDVMEDLKSAVAKWNTLHMEWLEEEKKKPSEKLKEALPSWVERLSDGLRALERTKW